MPTAHVNGITINYQLEGDGPETIVLINGLADDLASWDFQVPALLDAGLRVLRFDNRGIGATDKPAGPYTSRLLADDAKALVDHLGLTDFHLMGVSMGGMIAQEYALAYGGRPEVPDARLHLCRARSVLLPDVRALGRHGQGDGRPLRHAGRHAVGLHRAVLRGARRRRPRSSRPPWRRWTMPLEAYLAQLTVIQTHDTTERLERITTPTLGARGRGGHPHPGPAVASVCTTAVPDAEWATVPGGHACMWETPEPFNTTLIDFVRAHCRLTRRHSMTNNSGPEPSAAILPAARRPPRARRGRRRQRRQPARRPAAPSASSTAAGGSPAGIEAGRRS